MCSKQAPIYTNYMTKEFKQCLDKIKEIEEKYKILFSECRLVDGLKMRRVVDKNKRWLFRQALLDIIEFGIKTIDNLSKK